MILLIHCLSVVVFLGARCRACGPAKPVPVHDCSSRVPGVAHAVAEHGKGPGAARARGRSAGRLAAVLRLTGRRSLRSARPCARWHARCAGRHRQIFAWASADSRGDRNVLSAWLGAWRPPRGWHAGCGPGNTEKMGIQKKMSSPIEVRLQCAIAQHARRLLRFCRWQYVESCSRHRRDRKPCLMRVECLIRAPKHNCCRNCHRSTSRNSCWL